MKRNIIMFAVMLMLAQVWGVSAQSQSVNLTAGGEYKVGKRPVSIAVADFNKNGNPDLAIANKKSNDVVILKGDGKGEFKKVRTITSVVNPTSIIVGDFNKDGKIDLAVANKKSNSVTVLFGE